MARGTCRGSKAPVWAVIPFAPHYDASTDGRVRQASTGRVLLPTVSRRARGGGYLTVSLVLKTGRRANIYLHRAIAAAHLFLGVIPRGTMVCHRDDDPANNALSNLYVGSPRQNAIDARANGSRDLARREQLLAERRAGMDRVRAEVVRSQRAACP